MMVTVELKRVSFDLIEEAARTLGLTPAQYVGLAAVVAARDDLARLEVLRRRTGEAFPGGRRKTDPVAVQVG